MSVSHQPPSWMGVLPTTRAAVFLCVLCHFDHDAHPNLQKNTPATSPLHLAASPVKNIINTLSTISVASGESSSTALPAYEAGLDLQDSLLRAGADDEEECNAGLNDDLDLRDVQRRAAALSRRGQKRTAAPKSKKPMDPPVTKKDGGGDGGSSPYPHRAVGIEPTSSRDRLSFVLVAAAEADCACYGTRGAIAIDSLVPAGMGAAAYCQLIDEYVRRNASADALLNNNNNNNSTTGVLSVDVEDTKGGKQDGVRRVELRLSLPSHTSRNLLVAALELYPDRAIRSDTYHPLGSVLSAASAMLTQHSRMQIVLAAQEVELMRLRRQLQAVTVKRMQDEEEMTLRSVLEVVNAKKAKIRELTATLQHTQKSSAPTEAELPADSADDSDVGSDSGRSARTPPLTANPMLTAVVKTVEAPVRNQPLVDTEHELLAERHSTRMSMEELDAYKAAGMQDTTTAITTAMPASTPKGKKRARAEEAGNNNNNWLVDMFDMN